MADDLGARQRNLEMDNVSAGDAEERPALISPSKSNSHDVAEPAQRDTTCRTDGERHDSPPESDLPSDSLLGE